MKNKIRLVLLALPLILTSCLPGKGSNENYDVDKPNIGYEVDEASFTLVNGNKVTIKKDMNWNEFPAISDFYELNDKTDNWDEALELKLNYNDQITDYSSKGKVRYTNKDNKHGWYAKYESGKFLMVDTSTSPAALAYNNFSYTTFNNKYVSFFGRIPSDSTIESINSQGEEILYKDPDYEVGFYFKDDLPLQPLALDQEYSDSYRACNLLSRNIHSNYRCFSLNNMFLPLQGDKQTNLTYKITNKYLILNAFRPYGLFDFNIPGREQQVWIEQADSENCFINSEFIYNLDDGKLAYVESTFKTNYFSPEFAGIIIEGKLQLKTQKESDEGYNKYMEVRNKIMKEYTTKN